MAQHLTVFDRGESCWSRIGVFGPGPPTCPLLERVIHCQNCEIYSAAGRTLFDRQAPRGYADEWTAALRLGKETEQGDSLSLLVFRLGAEWLALATCALCEISAVRPIHSLPHLTDDVLLGIVNIRGRNQLCVSLAALLGIEAGAGEPRGPSSLAYRRMIVVERPGDRWVFPVDEIDGVRHFRPRHLREPPVTVARDRSHFTKANVQFGEDVLLASERGEGALPFQARQVGHLDHERLFEALRQRLRSAEDRAALGGG